MKYIPKNYQRQARSFIVKNKKAAVHIDMGLGKTVATLSAIVEMHNSFAISSVLIVAPLRVATITWPDEIRKWDHTKHLSYRVIRKSPVSRLIRDKETTPDQTTIDILSIGKYDIYITNYELMEYVLEWCENNSFPFDMIVLDESTKMKSGKSKRFKTCKHSINSFNRIIELTGTPMPEKYENLWSQYYLLDGGKRLEKFSTHFMLKYFDQNPYSRYVAKIKPGANLKIEKKISDITLTMKAEDWLALPGVIENDISIDMPIKLKSMYDEMENELLILLENGEEISGVNATVAREKCKQICAGFLYDEDKQVTWLHKLKMETLEEIIEQNDENILVVFWYKAEIDEIRKRWKNVPIIGSGTSDKDATKHVAKWNAGKYPLMFIHPQSVGHGINLQHGGRIMTFLSLPWSNEIYRQVIARLHRMGQSKPVMVHKITCANTVDSDISTSLSDKESVQQLFMRRLKRRRIS